MWRSRDRAECGRRNHHKTAQSRYDAIAKEFDALVKQLNELALAALRSCQSPGEKQENGSLLAYELMNQLTSAIDFLIHTEGEAVPEIAKERWNMVRRGDLN